MKIAIFQKYWFSSFSIAKAISPMKKITTAKKFFKMILKIHFLKIEVAKIFSRCCNDPNVNFWKNQPTILKLIFSKTLKFKPTKLKYICLFFFFFDNHFKHKFLSFYKNKLFDLPCDVQKQFMIIFGNSLSPIKTSKKKKLFVLTLIFRNIPFLKEIKLKKKINW